MDNKILLVDDEEDIRDVLGITLMDIGYDVVSAENGKDALEIFESESPDIVLSDIKMPGMDGIELLKILKEKDPEIEVIMITGHGDMDLAIRSLKYEATDFITKPINDDVLEIALKRARERMTMRRQLREYTENLERLVEEKSRRLIEAERLAAIGETIAGLSHTIKNIASGLKGGTFVLEKGIELDDKNFLQDGWRMIKGNVDKIAELSMALLNYGKYATIDTKPGDPNQPVNEAVAFIASVVEENGIELDVESSPNLKTIHFDPEAIQQCLLNILMNAVDACKIDTSEGKMKKIVVRTLSREQGGVEYQIVDNGVGMDEETQKNLFRSFFSTKGSKGTGIGLMTSKKIVDQHGGDIEVISSEGNGATFIVRLPAQ